MMEGFPGSVLKDRRLEMGCTPEDVFQKTRIPTAYVRGMESGDLSAMPPPCYALGFLRTYCRFLRLDPEPFLRAYQTAGQPGPRVLLRRTADGWDRLLTGRFANTLTWVSVCAFIALCWLAYNIIVQPNADIQEKRVDAVTTDMVVPEPVAAPGSLNLR